MGDFAFHCRVWATEAAGQLNDLRALGYVHFQVLPTGVTQEDRGALVDIIAWCKAE